MVGQLTHSDSGRLTEINPNTKANKFLPFLAQQLNQPHDWLHITMGSPGSLTKLCFQGLLKDVRVRAIYFCMMFHRKSATAKKALLDPTRWSSSRVPLHSG